MEKYDITKLDLYSFEGLNRGELTAIHSLLLFLYSKYNKDPRIPFKYSQIKWMSRESVCKTANKIIDMQLVNLEQRPTKTDPMIICLKTNEELQQLLLNPNKLINFEKYKNGNLKRGHLREVLECQELGAFFDTTQISSWLRNVNSGTWHKEKFLMIFKIISLFDCDYKIRTATLNKYSTLKTFFRSISFLYSKLTLNKQEIIHKQLGNSLKKFNKKNNNSFVDMVKIYLNSI